MKDLLRVYKIMLSHWIYLLLGFILMLGYAVFNGVSITMVIPLFDYVFKTEKKQIQIDTFDELSSGLKDLITSLNFDLTKVISILDGKDEQIMSQIKDFFLTVDSVLLLKLIAIIVIFLIVMKNIFFFGHNYMFINLRGKTVVDIRNNLFDRYLKQSLAYFSRNKVGDSIVRMINDVEIVSKNLMISLFNILRDLVLIFVFVYIAIMINFRLFLISLIIFPLFTILVSYLGKKIKKYAKRIQNQMSSLFNNVEEALNNIKIVKTFSKESFERDKFKNLNKKFFKYWRKAQIYNKMNSPLGEITSALAGSFVLVIGGMQVLEDSNSFSLGSFTAFLLALFSILHPLKVVSKGYANIRKALVSLNRISKILDLRPKIMDIKKPYSKRDFKNKIEMKNVSFSYDGQTTVLDNINLTINKGEKVAFVGSSGAGKTTLVNLVPRLYDVSNGKILIDGIPLKKIKIKDLRNLFGIVTQESILFSTTVRENLAYGLSNVENITDEQINKALKISNSIEFIDELPNQYDEILHGKGGSLSGGQKQRLCIARAIISNPPILIFDEATSALDSESEKKVQDAIDQATRNRTVLVIAHRLSTVLSSDKIIVLDKGKIVCSGTHEELLEKCEKYRYLYTLQFDDSNKNTIIKK